MKVRPEAGLRRFDLFFAGTVHLCARRFFEEGIGILAHQWRERKEGCKETRPQGGGVKEGRAKLADDAGEGAGGGGVEALGHAAGEPGFAAGDDGVAHSFGHKNGIGCFGDSGVHEDAVGAELHGDGGVRGGADTGVNDHGNFSDAFAEDAESGGILNAEAGADRRGEGHDGGGASVDELASGDEVVVGVGEDDETFFDKDAGRFDELLGVWEKSLLVADDFELDPVGEADFAGEARGADGFVGGVTGGGVGEDEEFFAVNVIEKGFFRFVGEIDAADSDGDDVRAGSGVGPGHFREAAVLASADNQAGLEGAACNDQFVCHGVSSLGV